ncbi:hypothetical protein [Nocardiopsis kunsanensis]|uniref:hypothetical protein n=1 Tax=Nocardiopsis kunsanensis TaxID=141693 RepID=UPI00034B62F2|nr:hypothetical protein [Nocardiopsis kunsanensis]
MSPSEPSEPGPGRRRKNSESDTGQAERSPHESPRRAGSRRKESPRFGLVPKILVGVLALALIALGVVLVVQRGVGEDSAEAAPETRPALYNLRLNDSSEMNRVLNSREDDQRPLNEGELFERNNEEISSQSIDFTLRDSELTEDCSEAVWGARVQEALTTAECTQAGRATYVSEAYFGVAAIFNLVDTEAGQGVAEAMELPETGEEGAEGEEPPEDPGFVLAPSGEEPFDRLGEGYGAADAIISGHYLVVVWVQPRESESVDDRVTLSSPLVALANFRDPLYRRLVELRGPSETEGGGTGEGAPGDGGAGTGTGEGAPGDGGAGTGTGEGAPGGGTGGAEPPVQEEPLTQEPPVQEPGSGQ